MRAPLSIEGPSRPSPSNPEGGDYAIRDADGQIIAETFRRSSTSHTHDARAAATLFAAAPDLLDALRAANARLLARMHTDSGEDVQAYTHACTAIAKASGITRLPGGPA